MVCLKAHGAVRITALGRVMSICGCGRGFRRRLSGGGCLDAVARNGPGCGSGGLCQGRPAMLRSTSLCEMSGRCS
eukprot:1283879-Pyramimonas_sp.AAC.1